MAMLPLLFVLSLETLCLGTVLAIVCEWREERKANWIPKKGAGSLIVQIIVSLCLGFVVAPALVSALGLVSLYFLDAGPGVLDWCVRLGGAWVHDAFPEFAPWPQFVWEALAMSVELPLFALLAARIRKAMLTHQSISDPDLSHSLVCAKMRVIKKSLAWATSIVLAYHWLAVALEVVHRYGT